MTLEFKTTNQLQQLIDDAKTQAQAARVGLLRDGQPLYAPDEHARRVAEIETTHQQTIKDVLAETQRRLDEIDPQLVPVEVDPLTTLSPEALAKASALAPFVREDIEQASQRGGAEILLRKLRAVVQGNDTAVRAVWLRYGRDVETGKFTVDQRQELTTLLDALATPFKPNTKRTEELQERAKGLRGIQTRAMTERYLQQAYGNGYGRR